MNNSKIDKFVELERNLEATIHEGTVKLGYIEGQSVGIYYNIDLLLYLLRAEHKKQEDLMKLLEEFTSNIEEQWGKIKIEKENKRYKFIVSSKGVNYIVKKNANNTFLKDLIHEMELKDCNVESILDIFRKYSKDVIVETSDNDEFEYIIYFKDRNLDPFKYCFTFDEMGRYYHRLTDYDFEQLIKE